MSSVADDQVAQWLVNGSIAGINSKEEEQRVVQQSLMNYCPGVEHHVTEPYSPPRVSEIAKKLGLIPGMAFDITVNHPDDDRPWDFNDPEKADKARKII